MPQYKETSVDFRRFEEGAELPPNAAQLRFIATPGIYGAVSYLNGQERELTDAVAVLKEQVAQIPAGAEAETFKGLIDEGELQLAAFGALKHIAVEVLFWRNFAERVLPAEEAAYVTKGLARFPDPFVPRNTTPLN